MELKVEHVFSQPPYNSFEHEIMFLKYERTRFRN